MSIFIVQYLTIMQQKEPDCKGRKYFTSIVKQANNYKTRYLQNFLYLQS